MEFFAEIITFPYIEGNKMNSSFPKEITLNRMTANIRKSVGLHFISQKLEKPNPYIPSKKATALPRP
ncbi:hypothetical protein HRbin03_00045 [archaeon HR03]|nr:hypothetical protein HRbin03_00045 [archaeon HR03]